MGKYKYCKGMGFLHILPYIFSGKHKYMQFWKHGES